MQGYDITQRVEQTLEIYVDHVLLTSDGTFPISEKCLSLSC